MGHRQASRRGEETAHHYRLLRGMGNPRAAAAKEKKNLTALRDCPLDLEDALSLSSSARPRTPHFTAYRTCAAGLDRAGRISRLLLSYTMF